MSGYQRLTLKLRYQIELLKSKGASNSEVALEVNVARSTITRELRLSSSPYRAEIAIKNSKLRSLRRSDANRKIKGEIKTLVDSLIEDDLSPEQVEAKINVENGVKISLKTIYRYIERDKLEGGKLKSHLRILRKQRKDRKKPKYRADQGLVRNKTPIDKRPKIVEKRNRVGDYERDTMLGKRGGAAMLAIVDRTTRYLHLACLPKNQAEYVHKATVKLLKNTPVKTVTNDNGTEFAFHEKTSKALGVKVYFSKSYRAWERGTNENTIGLLRQYFPKGKAIPLLNRTQLKAVEDKLNKRPKKCLGFQTPYELYRQKQAGRLLR